MKANIKKWKGISKRYQFWDSKKARKTQRLESEIIIKWLKNKGCSSYSILEIGCGNGYLGKQIISYFLKSMVNFKYNFTDIIPENLEKTKENLDYLKTNKGVKLSILDVFLIDKVLAKDSQDIIISTGFTAAATYKQAVPKVAKVLKPGGVLICDFINHFSLPVFLSEFPKILTRLVCLKNNALDPLSKRYHLGKFGIKEYFGLYNLNLEVIKPIGWGKNPLIAMFIKRQ